MFYRNLTTRHEVELILENLNGKVLEEKLSGLSGGFALALGSGGARGYAHIGVLKTLEEHGLTPSFVVGTSAGAAFGAFWAAGYSAAEIEELLSSFRTREILKLLFGKLPGRPNMDRVEELCRELFLAKGVERVEDFRVPYAAVSADLSSGERVLVTGGDPALAVRASGSMPFFFAPLAMDGRFLIDGMLVEPLPWRSALELGATQVLAVDVSVRESQLPGINWAKRAWSSRFGQRMQTSWEQRHPGSFGGALQKSMCLIGAGWEQEPAQIPEEVIHLEVSGHQRWFDFSPALNLVAQGEQLAREAIARLMPNPTFSL